jgi:hypothetical protein
MILRLFERQTSLLFCLEDRSKDVCMYNPFLKIHVYEFPIMNEPPPPPPKNISKRFLRDSYPKNSN